MSASSSTENSDHDIPRMRGRTITKWHVDNLAKKPYKITNTITQPWKQIWLYTSYIYCNANAKQVAVRSFALSKPVEIPTYPAIFNVNLYKEESEVVNIVIHRVMKDGNPISDEGYFLRLRLEICGSEHPGLYTDMTFDKNFVSVPFEINECFQDEKVKEETVVKCAFWMYEMTNLDTHAAFISQNESLLKYLHASVEVPENAYSDLCLLMGCENLNCMFSGRQDEMFAKLKTALLTRSLEYATILVERLRCFEENSPFVNSTKIGVILGYICRGKMCEINVEECLELYIYAFKYAIPFLQKETSFFLSENLTEPDVLDVILSASAVDDWMLADAAVESFFRWKDSIVKSQKWNALDLHQAATIEILAKKKENHQTLF